MYFMYMFTIEIACTCNYLLGMTWLDTLYIRGDTLAVLPECTAGIQAILQKGVKEGDRTEKVIKVQVVVTTHECS